MFVTTFKDVVPPTLSLAQDRMSLFDYSKFPQNDRKYICIFEGKKNHWLSLKNKGTPL